MKIFFRIEQNNEAYTASGFMLLKQTPRQQQHQQNQRHNGILFYLY